MNDLALAVGDNAARKSACGDDSAFLSELFLKAVDNSVDERSLTEDYSAFHAVYGVAADDLFRWFKVYLRKL